MFGTRWAIVHRDQTFSEPLTRALEDVPRTAGSFASLRRVRVLSLSLHTSSARSLRTGDRFPEPFRIERRKSFEFEGIESREKLVELEKRIVVEFLDHGDKGIEYRSAVENSRFSVPFTAVRTRRLCTVPLPPLHRSLPFRNGR